MKTELIYLLGFAMGMVLFMFLPALVMAGVRLAGLCPFSHAHHVLVSQWVQIIWMAGVFFLMRYQLLRKRGREHRAAA